MKTIIVGFSSHPGIFATLIKLVTNSKVSHTYIRVPVPEYGENMIFQASGLSVNYTNFEVFKEKSTVIEEYEIDVDDDTFAYSELFRVTEAGKPYSMTQIIGFLLVLAARGFGIKMENPFKNGSKSYICVEAVADCIGLGDISEQVTQEDLRQWFVKHGRLIYRAR